MAGRIREALDSWHQRRTEGRWARLAGAVDAVDGLALRAVRAEAKGLRRHLDRAIAAADMRMSAMSGQGLPQMPLGTDWVWRPEAWRGRMAEPGAMATGARTALGDNLALYHDCPLGEVVVRQVANDPEPDMPPFGLAIDIFGFRGSFLSLAMNLPDEAVTGLKARHLVSARLVIDHEAGVKGFARLNIKHGPNQAQPVSNLGEGREKLAEFDLAYADLNEKRVERAWADLILNEVAMTRIVVRDVVVSRRPRAEL